MNYTHLIPPLDVGSDGSSVGDLSDLVDILKTDHIILETQAGPLCTDFLDSNIHMGEDGRARVECVKQDPHLGPRNASPIHIIVRESVPHRIYIGPQDDIDRIIQEEGNRADDLQYEIDEETVPRTFVFGECMKVIRRMLSEWRTYKQNYMNLVSDMAKQHMQRAQSEISGYTPQDDERDKIHNHRLLEVMRTMTSRWESFCESTKIHRRALLRMTSMQKYNIDLYLKLLCKLLAEQQGTVLAQEYGDGAKRICTTLLGALEQRRVNVREFREFHVQMYTDSMQAFAEAAAHENAQYRRAMIGMRESAQRIREQIRETHADHERMVEQQVREACMVASSLRGMFNRIIAGGSVPARYERWIRATDASISFEAGDIQKAIDHLSRQFVTMKAQIKGLLAHVQATDRGVAVSDLSFMTSDTVDVAATTDHAMLHENISKMQANVSRLSAALEQTYSDMMSVWSTKNTSDTIVETTLKIRETQQGIRTELDTANRLLLESIGGVKSSVADVDHLSGQLSVVLRSLRGNITAVMAAHQNLVRIKHDLSATLVRFSESKQLAALASLRDVRLRLDADDCERRESTDLLKKKERDLDILIDTLFENMAVVKGNVLQESSRYTEAITGIVSATKSYMTHRDLLDSVDYIERLRDHATSGLQELLKLAANMKGRLPVVL